MRLERTKLRKNVTISEEKKKKKRKQGMGAQKKKDHGRKETKEASLTASSLVTKLLEENIRNYYYNYVHKKERELSMYIMTS